MGIKHFLESTKTEMSHVKWPTRKHTVIFTVIVLVISVVVGYLLGGFDLLFKLILKQTIL